ncbi:MAG: acetylxylan esterase, partial [Candidatus Hydrogenedentes bacterium]|nr:acetylxylan esterase [Candidatus Hydrogenedentota bacterium]
PEPKMPDVIFGASEYIKDGLMPVTEWMGPSPWFDRMKSIAQDIWKHADVQTPAGPLPTDNLEVAGDLLESLSRLYWMTGEPCFKEWSFRLADYYLLHYDLLAAKRFHLRDHGCEILGGLSEAYVIASREDPARRDAYRPKLHAILDCILEKGVNKDGMMPNTFDIKTGEASWEMFNDSWGYVYDAFLTIAMVDNEPRYRDAVRHALENVHKYLGANWENGSADGYADSIESALNLLARIPVQSAFDWVDNSIRYIFSKQRPDGILEAWYGDGNSARTTWIYVLQKTQGVAAAPWRDDVRLGAVRSSDGTLYIHLASEWAWSGRLRFDPPRHRVVSHMPIDYPRINQFPEWFTADPGQSYLVSRDGAPAEKVAGEALRAYALTLAPGQTTHITVQPENKENAAEMTTEYAGPLRAMRYTHKSAEDAAAWQIDLRAQIEAQLKIDALLADKANNPLDAKEEKSEARDGYTWYEISIASTPKQRIKIVVTIPTNAVPHGTPAVVCIHGHQGSRYVVYDPDTIYKGFATLLARKNFITIATDVEQHAVREEGHTPMGERERLWDLMRCVDYVQTLPECDPDRVGCAGLSLGGEMAMWLGAMDTRIRATVSCGFLTFMDQMECNHCMCWKFDGLRERVDFPDLYALIAPRALECQNGRKEPRNQFPPLLAEQAMRQVRPAYEDLGHPENVVLTIHDGAHEVEPQALIGFLAARL